jgi:hypothetical protein
MKGLCSFEAETIWKFFVFIFTRGDRDPIYCFSNET